MTLILNRVLGALDLVYRFQGQRTTVDQVELAAPIQLVHDVSREAELGAGIAFGGMIDLQLDNDHATVDQVYDAVSIAASNTNFWNRTGLNEAQSWVWLHEATVICNAPANFQFAFLAILQGNFQGGARFQEHERTIAFWNTPLIALAEGGSIGGATSSGQPPNVVNLPCLVPPDSSFSFLSDVDFAATRIAACQLKLQVLPRGVGPYGYR